MIRAMARTPTPAYRNRIVGQGTEKPDQLLANPANWRIHPKRQQEALEGSLSEVGWVQQIIVNKTTGHVVDGHARVALAISAEEAEVPVLYVELTEEEERLVLATLDPIAAMAGTDREQLGHLLEELEVGADAGLADLLEELRDEATLPEDGGAGDPAEGRGLGEGMVIAYQLVFDDEEQQQRWYGFLKGLRQRHPDLETHAARVDRHLQELEAAAPAEDA